MIPREIGGGGPIGADTVAETFEAQLRRALGVGLYSEHRDSPHGEHRRTLGAAIGYGWAWSEVARYEQQPVTSLYLLSEWERLLGVGAPRLGWGYEERWGRIRARLLEVGGNTMSAIARIFLALTGSSVLVVSDATYKITPTLCWPPNKYAGTVLFPAAVAEDEETWIEVQRTRRRLRPAGGDIYAAVTHDGAADRRPQFRCGESQLGRDTFGLNA